MHKFIPPVTAEQQIQDNVNLIKQQFARKQKPSKNAPKLPSDLLVSFFGCVFKIHKQDKNLLVIAADSAINNNDKVAITRATTYMVGGRDFVSIYGWDWRPVRCKKNKVWLRPFAPTIM